MADVPEEAPAAVEQSVSIVAEDDGDEQADDEDEDEGEDEENAREGGFSRFLHLFVAPADDEDEAEADGEDDEAFAELEHTAGGVTSMEEPRKITT